MKKDISFEIKIPKIKFPANWKGKGKMIFSVLLVVGAFVAMKQYDFTFFGTLILIYFGISLLWKLTSRISASFALFFLASCPILLILKNDSLAETFAIYAYYFLVITVVSEIVELRRDNFDS